MEEEKSIRGCRSGLEASVRTSECGGAQRSVDREGSMAGLCLVEDGLSAEQTWTRLRRRWVHTVQVRGGIPEEGWEQ